MMTKKIIRCHEKERNLSFQFKTKVFILGVTIPLKITEFIKDVSQTNVITCI